jgi:hypothetical protein
MGADEVVLEYQPVVHPILEERCFLLGMGVVTIYTLSREPLV